MYRKATLRDPVIQKKVIARNCQVCHTSTDFTICQYYIVNQLRIGIFFKYYLIDFR
jgi:hypothetical protein